MGEANAELGRPVERLAAGGRGRPSHPCLPAPAHYSSGDTEVLLPSRTLVVLQVSGSATLKGKLEVLSCGSWRKTRPVSSGGPGGQGSVWTHSGALAFGDMLGASALSSVCLVAPLGPSPESEPQGHRQEGAGTGLCMQLPLLTVCLLLFCHFWR